VLLRVEDQEICESLKIDGIYQAMLTLSRAKSIEFTSEVKQHKHCVTAIVHPNIEVMTNLKVSYFNHVSTWDHIFLC